MTDYRSMFDRDYIGAWDLPRDAVVTISKVEAATLVAQGNKKAKKPVLYFEGKEKGLACNKTNAKTIAAMYGNDTAKWIGKRITIYATKTMFGSEQVDCIRVRPSIPRATTNGKPAAPPPDEADPPPPDDFVQEGAADEPS